MSKKISTIFLTLFLVGILLVSCSNKDKTDPRGIEQYNGNSYVSKSAVMQSLYLQVQIKDGEVCITGNNSNTSEPEYIGYMNVTGSGTDYNFSSDYYGQPNGIEGTLKFSDTSVTVKFTKNPELPTDLLNKDIVCNKKQ